MKKKTRKKLSLDKIKVAQLNNYTNIIGGAVGPTQPTSPKKCKEPSMKICDWTVSTKTIPLGYTANCDGFI